MSMILRDPILRELMLDDYERQRWLRQHQNPLNLRPVRVHRVPLSHPLVPRFDHALSELQSVMDTVNDAIGQYQAGLTQDVVSGGMKTSRTEDGNLQVAVDVAQFKPEEVNVRLCDDNLVIEAKTESSENDNYHRAELKRWLRLPADAKHDAIKSSLTPDNKLVIEVPMNKPIENSRSRSIPIEVQKPAVDASKKGGDQQEQSSEKDSCKKK